LPPNSPSAHQPNTTQLLMVDGLFYLSDSRVMVMAVVVPRSCVDILFLFEKINLWALLQ